MAARIMYVEDKREGLVGPATISRVTFSKSGRSVSYRGLRLHRVRWGYKYNHEDDCGGHWWISGPKRRGGDRLYAGGPPVWIDEDIREDYWRAIRGLPDRVEDSDASR